MGFGQAFEPPFVKIIGRVQADADIPFSRQRFSDFAPSLSPLPLVADKIEMRREQALKSLAAAFFCPSFLSQPDTLNGCR
jgi:hypothetical protein